VHIGNLLGAGEGHRAFVTAFSSVYAIAVLEVILAVLIWALRYQLIQLWSQGDKHLEAIGGEVIAFVALAQILGVVVDSLLQLRFMFTFLALVILFAKF
jgi:Na+-driven multidrug efflux pump